MTSILYEEEAQFAKLPPIARMDGPPNYSAIAMTKKVAAATIWLKKVGQNMEWDHKPKLRQLFPGVRHKQGQYEYFYDIWSNIHYGYVGIIGGFSESVLLDGAGVEQFFSDTYSKANQLLTDPNAEKRLPGPRPTASPWTQLRSWDDVADRVSISLGISLAEKYPRGGLSAKIIMEQVLAIQPMEWGDGISAHVCD